MELTKEREQEIANMANAEWVDLFLDAIPDDDPRWEALELEWDEKALNFCKQNANPLELHSFASQYNWDQGADILLDIVKNPNCDFGTARLIFWRSSPDYYQTFVDRDSVPSVNLEGWDFVWKVVKACEGRTFKISNIVYDPKAEHFEPVLEPNAKWQIPEKFL